MQETVELLSTKVVRPESAESLFEADFEPASLRQSVRLCLQEGDRKSHAWISG